MKRLIVFLAIAGLTTLFTFGQSVETRSVSNFTGIDASGAFEITVVKGNTDSLNVEANDNVMPYVRSELRNGVLRLYLDRDIPRRVNNRTVKATVVMRDLEKVSLSGACKITANDLFTPENFKGDCSGSSGMTINVNTGKLTVNASGACNLQIKANVNGDTKINSSGSSKIGLAGSAKSLSMDLSGASNVKAEDFIAGNATIKSSGSCNVSVDVTGELKVNSSGSSTVNYKGTPAITINSSGSSRVRSI
jgi:hypothetical protein